MTQLHILLVDSEPAMRRAICRVLGKTPMHLHEFDQDVEFMIDESTSGADAELKLQFLTPDLVIIDDNLPDVEAVHLIEGLSHRKLDMLVILMSAYASVESVVMATRQGAYDFLAKPFTPEEVRASIRKAAKHLLLRRHARKLAEEKRAARFQAMSVLAHELKSPLASIDGYLRILKDGSVVKDPGTTQRIVDRSLIRLDGMRKLILDILDLTRLESGQKQRKKEDTDVCELTRRAFETADVQAKERNIELTLNCAGKTVIRADRGEMEIVMNNLVSNAIKYNRDGGRVTVSIDGTGPRIVWKVTDTGIGMSKDEMTRLFEEFYRVKNERTRNILGSGLGLAVVKKIVLLYQGEITVNSKENEGTTFTIVLDFEPTVNSSVDTGSLAFLGGR
ncbi:hybrid sensor histidine kinase/response regulator [bacterium]|nr:hybrid sensor histidine kinase/response regulator [candidate division CSSED10-310 bacterium]